jgi:hypothetical protein
MPEEVEDDPREAENKEVAACILNPSSVDV